MTSLQKWRRDSALLGIVMVTDFLDPRRDAHTGEEVMVAPFKDGLDRVGR
jgi:hypothetical protein